MSELKKFTENEIEQLENSIIMLFQAIAGADTQVDTDELTAISDLKHKAEKFQSRLFRELLIEFEYTPDRLKEHPYYTEEEIRKGLRAVADIVSEKLDTEAAMLFKKSLLVVGMYIANASGDVFLPKISNEELQILTELSLFMRMPRKEVYEEPTVETIYQTLF